MGEKHTYKRKKTKVSLYWLNQKARKQQLNTEECGAEHHRQDEKNNSRK